MNVQDLWGEGATLTGGVLTIPRVNLQAIGLSPTNTDESAIALAVLLLAHQYFEGALVDFDGALLSDDNGDVLGYDANRNEANCNFFYSQKQYSEDEMKLYWIFLITFFEAVEGDV